MNSVDQLLFFFVLALKKMSIENTKTSITMALLMRAGLRWLYDSIMSCFVGFLILTLESGRKAETYIHTPRPLVAGKIHSCAAYACTHPRMNLHRLRALRPCFHSPPSLEAVKLRLSHSFTLLPGHWLLSDGIH